MRGQRMAMSETAQYLTLPKAVGKHRSVYDAKNGSSLPGTLVRDEGQAASGDAAVDEAYDGAGSTYDLYLGEYERNSIEQQRYAPGFNRALPDGIRQRLWNGKQMVYGDGDEDLPS
jgi:Zn-dependent metalloprotease